MEESARMHMSEFPESLHWADQAGSVSASDLGGSVTIIVFWRLSDCETPDVLRKMNRLSMTEHEDLSIVGIHIPHFSYERDQFPLEDLIQKHSLEFPVAHDPDLELAKRLDINTTPGFVILDSEAEIVAKVTGRIQFDEIQQAIGVLLDDENITPPTDQSLLSGERDLSFYPEDVAVSPDGEIIAISNPVNGEVRLYSNQGDVLGCLGAGVDRTQKNSKFGDPGFELPTGLCFDGPDLLVCGTASHGIYRIDFNEDRVTQDLPLDDGEGAPIQYPYRICQGDQFLWISSTGTHSIWRWDPLEEQAQQTIGSGSQGLLDGIQIEANLSDPVGLVRRGDEIVFVDSSTSALRSFHREKFSVHTFLGEDLLTFGDRDGDAEEALLQFPVDLTIRNEEEIVIVDSYNHKLKRFDVEKSHLKTWLGSGNPGNEVGPDTEFYEPRGIDNDEDSIYVADSMNQRVLEIEKETGRSRVFVDPKK